MTKKNNFTRYAYLLMVTEDNHNKFYEMTEAGDRLIISYGRVGSTKSTRNVPIGQWNSIYNSKIKKGYRDMTDIVAVRTDENGVVEKKRKFSEEPEVSELFETLQLYARDKIVANYRVSSSKVTVNMVETAQGLIDKLTSQYKKGEGIDELNKTLLELFMFIPRKMSDVHSCLFSKHLTSDDIESKIESEQKLLDALSGQVQIQGEEDEPEDDMTLLEKMGLTARLVTDEETILSVKRLMGKSMERAGKIYEITNLLTEKKYNELFAKSEESRELLLFHGSRNENWFNILQTGLLIKPAGVVHTGSMFGAGIYFANKAQKSLGYTSMSGSYWAKGTSEKTFLSIFRVNVGRQMDVSSYDSGCCHLNEKRIAPYNSVFAHANENFLRNDELIIYDSNRCTIKFLVEINS